MPDAAMEEIFEVVFRIVLFLAELFFDGFYYVRSEESFRKLCTWEWIGFLGASAWLIVSLGRVKWENNDWRALLSGSAIFFGGLVLIVWFGLSHYSATEPA